MKCDNELEVVVGGLYVWGCGGTVMRWCSWIHLWGRARRFTPGQAPLLWRTACSTEPARWVWCQTWAQCCSMCPEIPPGPQIGERKQKKKITLLLCFRAFSYKLHRKYSEDLAHMLRNRGGTSDELSCETISLKGLMWLVFCMFEFGILYRFNLSAICYE